MKISKERRKKNMGIKFNKEGIKLFLGMLLGPFKKWWANRKGGKK